MTNEDNGGPAFPPMHDPNTHVFGMTLRDYFATHASDGDVRAQADVIRAQIVQQHGIGILPDNWHVSARYMHADAMLKARTQ